MQLTPHFSLSEFTKSATGEAAGIKNEPDDLVIARLHMLAATLERVRAMLGASITVKSGYRNRVLNSLLGGSNTSAHMQGWAADIKVAGYTPRQVATVLAESAIAFDQVILEDVSKLNPDGVWVHISVDPQQRRELLTMKSKNGKKEYLKGLV